jgi:membrane protein required for colicin V production
MPALDWIFAAVLLLSMLLGVWRGLVYELLSLVSWIAAFVVAQWLAQDVAGRLPISGGGSDVLRYGAGFLLVFVATVMLGSLLAVVAKKLLTTVGLRPVDRVLGAAFGLCRGVLLALLASALVSISPMKKSAVWQESRGAELALLLLKGLKPMLAPELERFLPA